MSGWIRRPLAVMAAAGVTAAAAPAACVTAAAPAAAHVAPATAPAAYVTAAYVVMTAASVIAVLACVKPAAGLACVKPAAGLACVKPAAEPTVEPGARVPLLTVLTRRIESAAGPVGTAISHPAGSPDAPCKPEGEKENEDDHDD
jgi:hypothetical protein